MKNIKYIGFSVLLCGLVGSIEPVQGASTQCTLLKWQLNYLGDRVISEFPQHLTLTTNSGRAKFEYTLAPSSVTSLRTQQQDDVVHEGEATIDMDTAGKSLIMVRDIWWVCKVTLPTSHKASDYTLDATFYVKDVTPHK